MADENSFNDALPWALALVGLAGVAGVSIAALRAAIRYEDAGGYDAPDEPSDTRLNAGWSATFAVKPGRFKEAFVAGTEAGYTQGFYEASGRRPDERRARGIKLDAEEKADQWLAYWRAGNGALNALTDDPSSAACMFDTSLEY